MFHENDRLDMYGVREQVHHLNGADPIKRDKALKIPRERFRVAGDVRQPRGIHFDERRERLRMESRSRRIHDHRGQLHRKLRGRKFFQKVERILADKFRVLEIVGQSIFLGVGDRAGIGVDSHNAVEMIG